MKIGIDLGGTKTEAILIDHNGKELSRKRIKTEKNYQGTLNGIKSLAAEFENEFGLIESIGIGMPGAISVDSSLVKNANSIWLNGKPIKKDLENQIDREINLENDANCFALSEAVDGAGKDFNIVFGSEKNLINRYFKAANTYDADYIVRVTSDCPFVDPILIDEMANMIFRSDLDFVTNVCPPTWPDGLDITIFSRETLNKTKKHAKLDSEREHVVPWMCNNSNLKEKKRLKELQQ